MQKAVLNLLLRSAFTLIPFIPQAQTSKAYERAGDQAFRDKDYGAAMSYYSTSLERNAGNYDLRWKYADAALYYNAFEEAEASYREILSHPQYRQKFPLVDFKLGEIEKTRGRYESALSHYEHFLTAQPSRAEEEYYNRAESEITSIRAAQKLLSTSPVLSVNIQKLGREVNSPYSEFAPYVVGDTLFYSSYRFNKKKKRGVSDPFGKISKVLMSTKGGKGREPGKGFPNTDTAHVAHTAFSPDGHYVIFTVCENENASDVRCELWLTVLDRRGKWLPAMRLPSPINLPGYTSTQPNIGYDQNNKMPMLWFASDRPGGKGKLDIWSTPLDSNFFCECNLPLPGRSIGQLPKFGYPVNVETLNTPENDGMPFFHTPSQKFYFSSDGRDGLGGWDVFQALGIPGDFSGALNMGSGINTSYNDIYFFLREDGKRGYLSSNRPGSTYLDEKMKTCCNDIYAFEITPNPDLTGQPLQPTPPTPQQEDLRPKNIEPVKPVAPLLPEWTEFIGLPLYFDNDEPDKRSKSPSTNLQYEETVQEYLARRDIYQKRLAQGLNPEKAAMAEDEVNLFFESEIKTGFERLTQLCEVLETRLKSGDHIEILIKGFTSPRAKSDYNLNLSKRRIACVRNYIAGYNDGALQPFLQKGALAILETGFGESAAKSGISDLLHDERGSIYHPDAARERRVEIVEIRQKK